LRIFSATAVASKISELAHIGLNRSRCQINVKVIEGVFSPEQKTQIIRKPTDAMVDIEGEAMRAVTWAVIEEVKSGDWGIAGKSLSTADVRALATSHPAKVG
jgi:4-oxalocrotonate tautomerase